MTARAYTVAFEGVEARRVEVQCAVSAGVPCFTVVGLPDKAVTEAKERVRAAMTAMAIALPSKRITVNLSPADLPKEGSHFDLPIALALLAAVGVLPPEEVEGIVALGELSLDGSLVPVIGALPAAMAAAEDGRTLVCPAACAPEAAWVGATTVIGPASLAEAIAHLTDRSPLEPAVPGELAPAAGGPCLRDVRGQERAKRALEIAATGRHHLLMVGPPGSGKSMLAARLPGILPPMSPRETLETSMIHSVSGLIEEGRIDRARPFMDPHHTASMAAIVGGGKGAKPGQISMAHNGVLFMDEFPEFPRTVLETLRQPVETGEVIVARANAHVRYPCRFLLVAAANPCRCGFLTEPARACSQGAGLRGGLHEPHLGAPDGPLRPAGGGPAGLACGPRPAALGRHLRCGGRARGRGPRDPIRAPRRPGCDALQRRPRGRGLGAARPPRRGGAARSSPPGPRRRASRPAATTASCAWRAPSRTWRARKPCDASTSPRRWPTASCRGPTEAMRPRVAGRPAAPRP